MGETKLNDLFLKKFIAKEFLHLIVEFIGT